MPCEPLLGRGPDRPEKGGIYDCSAERNRTAQSTSLKTSFAVSQICLFLFLGFVWGQPDTPEHLLVPRVRVQRAKPRVAPEMDHSGGTVFISLFKPGEGLIRAAKPRIDSRDLEGESAPVGQPFQMLKDLLCISSLS